MSRNLKKKMMSLTPIEDWADRYPGYGLSQLFYQSLNPNIFANIYVAIRHNPENSTESETETWNYYNVGANTNDIAEYFGTKYGLNYFAYNFESGADCATLESRIESIYKANLYKYRKLIESMGYTYNPLFNVDGIELYSNAESLGNSTSEQQPTGELKTVSGTENQNTVGDSTTTHYVNPYDKNDNTANFINDRTTQSAITQKQTFGEGTNAYKDTTTVSHKSADNYKYNDDTGEWEKDGLFGIKKADVAFGINFGGPERFYAEKRIRQGNIGVTKSTELLRDQRDIVRFNILDEFFKDLEPHIVVGIF